jgi:hypothetical protein
MTTIRSLAEVGARLDKAAALLPGEPADPADTFDRYESVAISILDSENADFKSGQLQEFLSTFLYLKRQELGLVAFPDPREA